MLNTDNVMEIGKGTTDNVSSENLSYVRLDNYMYEN